MGVGGGQVHYIQYVTVCLIYIVVSIERFVKRRLFPDDTSTTSETWRQ